MKKIIYLSVLVLFSMLNSQLIAQNPSDSTDVFGCMDPIALNYNPFATIDDGSCIYQNDSTGADIYGCMDPAALNYNFLATIDDGSCIYENDSTVFDIYGCMDTAALNYDPLATIDNGSCMYFCDSTWAYFDVTDIDEENGVVTIVNYSGSNIDIVEYLWDFGDGTTSTDQFPTHTYENDGFYLICLTVVSEMPTGAFNCTATYCDSIGVPQMMQKSNGFTINIISNTATGIDSSIDLISELILYPNPANNIINSRFTSSVNESITLNIYDLSGRIVKTWNATIQNGNNKLEIDITDLNPGLYQLEMRNNNERKVKRFQVIR
jgi:hypothetical protein